VEVFICIVFFFHSVIPISYVQISFLKNSVEIMANEFEFVLAKQIIFIK